MSETTLEDEYIERILTLVAERCAELNIDFFVLGAVAQREWYRLDGKKMRITKDIDLAVAISDPDRYAQLHGKLLEEPAFSLSANNGMILCVKNDILGNLATNILSYL